MKKAKRILAALLSLCMMTVLLPANIAFAQAATTVNVGSSVELSNAAPFALTDASGNVTTSNANELNWNVKFESGKLTLKNAVIKTAYSYFNGFAAIYAENDLTIELIGTNEIDVSGKRCHGISCAGNLIIQGSDSLTAITTGFESSPIFTNEGNVELNSGTLYLTGDDDSSSGIYAYNGDVNISGGTITAYGKGTRSNGIGATGNITVTGGTITAMATNMAFNKAPDLDGYRYTSTVSESITGTPTVNYIASDIAKYKYIKFENLETEKGIFAGRYSYRQVFDCQRNPSSPTQLQAGEQFKVSGFDLPMNAAASAASMIRFKENEIADKVFYFKKTNNNSAPFSMYMANDVSGTDETLVSVKGNIYGLGSKGFLYISNDDGYGNNLGYFITNEDGYKYGDKLTYTPDTNGPVTTEQAELYDSVNITPQEKTVTEIAVKTEPIKKVYFEDEKFEPFGLVLTMKYSDNSTKAVQYDAESAKDFSFSPKLDHNLTATDEYITIEYAGKTVNQPISVNVKELSSIAVKKAPSKVTYTEGEQFNPEGLIITLSYNNNTTEDVAYAGNESKFTFAPDLSSVLYKTNEQIVITYESKNTAQNIVVYMNATGIFNGRYSYRQVFDCQRNPVMPESSRPFTVSNFALPYDSVNTSQFTEAQISGKIFYFRPTFNVSEPFSLCMADDVNGLNERIVAEKGNIYALGVKGFLFIESAYDYGYFISNEAAYNYGDGFTYMPDITGPISKEQGDTYIGVNPAPENKVKETTPDVQLSINTMKLTPISERMQYSVDGGLVWLDVPADATISGVTLENGVCVKKLGDGVTTIDSNPQIIKIVKETPTVETKPQFGSLKVNNSLSSLTITGGVVKGTEDSIIKGVYTWKTPDDIMSDVGEFDKIIVFTPENNFYNDIEIPVKVTVYKTSSGGGTTRYTVKYNTNGGSVLSSSSVTRNSVLKEPTEPIKEGYTFDGWYTDSTLAAKYDFTAKVTKAFTLYAKWSEKSVDNSNNEIVLTIGDKTAIVFGESKTNDVAPKIVNDRTMLPARFVAENLGAKVAWDEKEQKVTVTKDEIAIIVYIDSNKAYVNGKEITLDSSAFIENDRTYTPLRFISENLGAKVEWDEKTQEVTITK